MIELMRYSGEKELLSRLIKSFWKAHNGVAPTDEEALEDCVSWTGENHVVYFIRKEEVTIGFVHLAARGCEIDWLEDLFILPEYQGRGYGSEVIDLVEEIVSEYSDSLYMEVAARNDRALRLYCRKCYNILNTITVRKDFSPEKYRTIGHENIFGHDFEVKE